MRWMDDPGAAGSRCNHCGAPEAEHEWRCDECGVRSTEIGTCGCGAVHMPKAACDCHRSWGLYCPESLRTITGDEYRQYQALVEINQTANAACVARGRPDHVIRLPTWEAAEIERLWTARNAS